jgi:hypothetical protein
MVARCTAQTTSGRPCSAQPVRPDGYCYWHSPATASERADARRRGGRNRSNQARAKKQLPAEVMTDEELLAWLGITFKRVIAGQMLPNVGNAAATIARAMVAVRQASELEERLAALEARAGLNGT